MIHDGVERAVAIDNDGFSDAGAAPSLLTIRLRGLTRAHVAARPPAVVFNPWIVKSKALADFGDEEVRCDLQPRVGTQAAFGAVDGTHPPSMPACLPTFLRSLPPAPPPALPSRPPALPPFLPSRLPARPRARPQYHVTIAVETAAIEAPITVAAGASWTGAQTFVLL